MFLCRWYPFVYQGCAVVETALEDQRRMRVVIWLCWDPSTCAYETSNKVVLQGVLLICFSESIKTLRHLTRRHPIHNTSHPYAISPVESCACRGQASGMLRVSGFEWVGIAAFGAWKLGFKSINDFKLPAVPLDIWTSCVLRSDHPF